MNNKNESLYKLQNITQNKPQVIYRRNHSVYGSRANSRSQINLFESTLVQEQQKQPKNQSVQYLDQSIYTRTKQLSVNKPSSSEAFSKEDTIKLLQDTIKQQNKEIRQLKMINLYLQQSINHRDIVIKKDRIQMSKLGNVITRQDNDQKHQSDRSQNIILKTPNVTPPKEEPAQPQIDSHRLNKSNMKLLVSISNQMFENNHTQIENEILNLDSIIDLSISDAEALNLYENDINIKFVRNITQQEDKFIKLIGQSNQHRLSVIFEKFRKITQDHNKLFNIILRLKNLLRASIDITETTLLDETLDKIVSNTSKCVDSDRCSCFVVDQGKKELWTRSAEGVDQIIRVPLTKGIVGLVATSREIVNIRNAHADPRFNAEIDIKSNYFTKNILTAPVCNKTETLAVLQCINKKHGYFTKDDEAVLKIISQFSKLVLCKQFDSDQSYIVHGKLRLMLKNGIKLQTNQQQTLKEFLFQAEKMLRQVLQTEKVRICVRIDQQSTFFDDYGNLKSTNFNSGIMNKSINRNSQINIMNSQLHTEFSTLIDIDTNLPTITKPFYGAKCVGALQVINIKGLQSGSKDFPYITQIDDELIGYFTDQITISLDRLLIQNMKLE